MTQIDFYTHAADKLHTACRLTAKALSQNLRVMIYTPDTVLADKLDHLLWTYSATGFVPHCRVGDALADKTPVLIGDLIEPLAHDELLLNLHTAPPPFFSRFHRLVEIASSDTEDARVARERFRFYKDRGYEILHHDLKAAK